MINILQDICKIQDDTEKEKNDIIPLDWYKLISLQKSKLCTNMERQNQRIFIYFVHEDEIESQRYPPKNE